MKKVVKLLAVLFIALSFYGCKNNDDEFNASITEVFYTNVNPDGFTLAELRDFKVTNIRNHSYCNYYLVLSYRQPNKDVVKMIMQYDWNGDVREDEYRLSRVYDGVDMLVWWNDAYWNFSEPESNKELKCYLEDASGRRSGPYTFHINLVQG